MSNNKLTVGELVYKISGDMDNLKTELKRTDAELKKLSGSMEKSQGVTKKLSDRFANLKLAVLGFATIALYKLKGAFSDAIENASNLSESINAVNVVFGEGADKIIKYGEGAAKSVGLANAEFNQLSTVTGALLKDTGMSMNEVSARTIELTERAADMASVFNTDVKDALSAINQAIRGETEAIRRYAGNVTDAEIQQELLSRGLKVTTADLSEQEKRLIRMDIIMRQTAVTAGDFANTSGEVANKARILKAEIQDKSAELGQKLLPLYSRWLDLSMWLVKNIDELTNALKVFFATVAGYVAASQLGKFLMFANAQMILLSGNAVKGTFFIGLKIKALILWEAALYRVRTAMLTLSTALGVLGAVTAGAIMLIQNASRKVEKAWDDAMDAQQEASDSQLNLLKINMERRRLAEESSSEKVKELANAEFEFQKGLIQGVTDEVRIQLHERRQLARQALNDDSKAVEEWANIHSKAQEKVTGKTEETAFSLDLTSSATDKAAEAAEKAAQKLDQFQSTLISTIESAKQAREELEGNLTSAFTQFGDSLKGNVEESVNSLAQIVIGAQDKIKELKEQLKNEEDSDAKKEIKKQIKEQEEILNAREDFEERQAERIAAIRTKLEEAGIDATKAGLDSVLNVRSLEEQIEEERRLASLDEFTRFEEQQSRMLVLLTDAFITETTLLKEKIETQKNFEDDLTSYLLSEESKRLTNTEAWAQSTIEKYKQVADSLKNLLSTQSQIRNIEMGSISPVSPSSVVQNSRATSTPESSTTNNNTNISAPVTINGQNVNNLSAKEISAIMGFELNKFIR